MKKDEKKEHSFENEYNNLFGEIAKKISFSPITEWKKEGDYFKKFSMYDERIGSTSSGSTTLIIKSDN